MPRFAVLDRYGSRALIRLCDLPCWVPHTRQANQRVPACLSCVAGHSNLPLYSVTRQGTKNRFLFEESLARS